MTTKRKPSRNWGWLLLLSLLAPGILSCGALSTPVVTPTVTPTLAPIPTPALPGILDALRQVPRGRGVPEAGTYNPDSPIPPRLVILDPSGERHEYNDHMCVPPEWQPTSLSETALVVVLGPEYEIELDTQSYLGGRPITRYRFERKVEIREAQSGRLLWTHTLQGSEPAPFPSVAFADQTRIDGGHVVFVPVLLYLQETLCNVPGQCPSALTPLQQSTQNTSLISSLSPDGQILAMDDRIDETSGGYYTQRAVVHLWQVTNGMLLHTLEHENPSLLMLDFSPDGQILATLSEDDKIWLWDVADGQLLHTMEGHSFIAFSPDGQILAAATGDGIQLWQVGDWKPLRILPEKGILAFADSYATFSSDNQFLASMTGNGLRLWRLSDGKLLLQSQSQSLGSMSLAFSPDSESLAELAAGEVRLYRTMDGKLLRTWDLGPGGGLAHGLKFSPDGQFLAIYLPGEFSNRGKVQLWRVSDSQQLYAQDGNWVIFSSDSQYLALVDAFEVKILRAADGALLHSLSQDFSYLLNDRLALGVTGSERHWVLCHIDLWSRVPTR